MEKTDVQTAYSDIVAHIDKQSGKYDTWYVDTTSNWKPLYLKSIRFLQRDTVDGQAVLYAYCRQNGQGGTGRAGMRSRPRH
jgi:hypothetical protein